MIYLNILRLLLKYNKHRKSAHIGVQLNEFSQTEHVYATITQIKKQHIISTPVVLLLFPSNQYPTLRITNHFLTLITID